MTGKVLEAIRELEEKVKTGDFNGWQIEGQTKDFMYLKKGKFKVVLLKLYECDIYFKPHIKYVLHSCYEEE